MVFLGDSGLQVTVIVEEVLDTFSFLSKFWAELALSKVNRLVLFVLNH